MLALCFYHEFVNIKIRDFFIVVLFVVIFIIIVILSMNSDNVTLTSLPTLYISTLVQCEPTKCTFAKLIFYFLMSSTCFEPEGSTSRRRLYIQLWYGTFYVQRYKYSSR